MYLLPQPKPIPHPSPSPTPQPPPTPSPITPRLPPEKVRVSVRKVHVESNQFMTACQQVGGPIVNALRALTSESPPDAEAATNTHACVNKDIIRRGSEGGNKLTTEGSVHSYRDRRHALESTC
jgi:hypothetical protein